MERRKLLIQVGLVVLLTGMYIAKDFFVCGYPTCSRTAGTGTGKQ